MSEFFGARKGGPRCRLPKNQKVYSKTQKVRTKDAAEPDIKNTKPGRK